MYCLDTYALVEIHDGNKKFLEIVNKEHMITSLTLAEFYGLLYKRFNEKTAEYWKRKLLPITKEVNSEELIEAIKFKIKSNVSFFDAIGYIYSLKHNYQFVTGDKEFAKLKNIKYLKK